MKRGSKKSARIYSQRTMGNGSKFSKYSYIYILEIETLYSSLTLVKLNFYLNFYVKCV